MSGFLTHLIEWAWLFGAGYYFAGLRGSLPVRFLGSLLWPVAALWTLARRLTG